MFLFQGLPTIFKISSFSSSTLCPFGIQHSHFYILLVIKLTPFLLEYFKILKRFLPVIAVPPAWPNFLRSSPTHEPPEQNIHIEFSRNNSVISISFCDWKIKMHENTNFMVYKHFHVVFQSSLMTYLTGVRSE